MIAMLLLIAACANQSDVVDVGDAASGTDSDGLPVLVRNAIRATEAHQALIHGVLVLDDAGCIRIGNAAGDAGPFVVWHHDSRIERTADGRLRVTDCFTGHHVHVGEPIALGGSGGPDQPGNVTPLSPAACAAGEFWMAGQLASQDERRAILERDRSRGVVTSPSQPADSATRKPAGESNADKVTSPLD